MFLGENDEDEVDNLLVIELQFSQASKYDVIKPFCMV